MRRIILNHAHSQRFQMLGKVGEELAADLLSKNGFTEIKNLNLEMPNFPYGDLLARRGDRVYVISVKARNKFQNCGKLNDRYKLGAKCYENAARAQELTKGAIPAWVAIAIEENTLDAYFGLLDQLNGSRGIKMTPDKTENYERLASSLHHRLDYNALRNRY
jgi:hypothetical protein